MHLEDKYFQAFDTSMEMHVDVIESSFKSTGDLVSALVVLYTKLSMFSKFLVHSWSQCESLGEKHSILVHLGAKLKSTLLSILKSTKMSLTLNGPIKKVLCSNLHTYSTHAPKTY